MIQCGKVAQLTAQEGQMVPRRVVHAARLARCAVWRQLARGTLNIPMATMHTHHVWKSFEPALLAMFPAVVAAREAHAKLDADVWAENDITIAEFDDVVTDAICIIVRATSS